MPFGFFIEKKIIFYKISTKSIDTFTFENEGDHPIRILILRIDSLTTFFTAGKSGTFLSFSF